MIKAKINLSKIDKSRIFTSEKTGDEYLDIIILDSPNDKYGNDYMIVEDLKKEERDAGKKGNILGNGKNFGSSNPSSTGNQPQSDAPPMSTDDLPF